MPWCEECARYLTPTTMTEGGTCPTCGRPVSAEAPAAGTPEQRAASEVEEDESTPWHFKLLVVALVVYLGWRFFQIFF